MAIEKKISPTQRAVQDTAAAVEQRTGGLIENMKAAILAELAEARAASEARIDAFGDRFEGTVKNRPFVSVALVLIGIALGLVISKVL